VDPLDNMGAAPLHWAAENGWDDVVRLLVAKGADVNRRDNDGYSALRLAKEDGTNDSTVALLRELGAKD
jgi:ankyrin repeat protein